jgi:hypothetical protein
MPDTIDINGDEPTSEPVPADVQPSAPTTAVLIDALHPGAKNYQFKPGDVVPATVLAREGERPDGAIQIVVHNPAFAAGRERPHRRADPRRSEIPRRSALARAIARQPAHPRAGTLPHNFPKKG